MENKPVRQSEKQQGNKAESDSNPSITISESIGAITANTKHVLDQQFVDLLAKEFGIMLVEQQIKLLFHSSAILKERQSITPAFVHSILYETGHRYKNTDFGGELPDYSAASVSIADFLNSCQFDSFARYERANETGLDDVHHSVPKPDSIKGLGQDYRNEFLVVAMLAKEAEEGKDVEDKLRAAVSMFMTYTEYLCRVAAQRANKITESSMTPSHFVDLCLAAPDSADAIEKIDSLAVQARDMAGSADIDVKQLISICGELQTIFNDDK